MQRKIRFLIPFGLLTFGVYLLVGCIPVPATRQLQPDLSYRPEHYVGVEEDKPVRLGYTHIDDALIVLSQHIKEPVRTKAPPWAITAASRIPRPPRINSWQTSADGRTFALSYEIRTTTWIMPLCFSIEPSVEQRWLILDTDERGIVTNTVTTANDPQLSPCNTDRWLTVFDAATRRKLHDAGVFPSDEQLTALSQRDRFDYSRPATTQATQPSP